MGLKSGAMVSQKLDADREGVAHVRDLHHTCPRERIEGREPNTRYQIHLNMSTSLAAKG